MGEYNSHEPIILGAEWVPIRNENTELTPAINAVEVGHSFLYRGASAPLLQGRFYTNAFPTGLAAGQVFMMAVYRQGEEDNSGPVQEVIIPCNAGSISGTASLVGGASVAACVSDPSDQSYITGTDFTSKFSAFFNVSAYQNQLTGKRIVGVKLLYGFAKRTDGSSVGNINVYLTNNYMLNQGALYAPYGGDYDDWGAAEFPVDLITAKSVITTVRELDLGEIDHFWSTANDPTSTVERLPWTLDGLLRLEATAANRKFIRIDLSGEFVNYLALKVLYCEETRLAYGGTSFGDESHPITFTGNIHRRYAVGANTITMRTPHTLTASPSLAEGDYSLVVSSAELGNLAQFALFPSSVDTSAYPPINAVRELYAIPAHPGVQNNLTEKPGDVFSLEQTHILPQLSLHTTSNVALTQVHGYGRQIAAPVYGSVTATQEILDDVVGFLQTRDYPQVRYYARRFGDTTVPLLLDSPNITGTGLSVSLMPAELDALPEVIDGWREVTLRFPVPPTMGQINQPQWRWSAVGEVAANRWEVLGMSAPALSGIAGDLLNEAPVAEQLADTTYGQDAINLTWLYPLAAAPAEDVDTDAVLIFSEDPNPITGIAVTQESQTLTAYTECGAGPCCIPTALQYNKITWNVQQYPSPVMFDRFTRTSVDAWGTPTVGYTAYTDTGGAASDYQVNGTQGTHTLTSTGVPRRSVAELLDVQGDFPNELVITVTIPVTATGAAIEAGIISLVDTVTTHHRASLLFGTDSSVTLQLVSTNAGVDTVQESVVVGNYVPGDAWHIRLSTDIGTTADMKGRAWANGNTEPSGWQVSGVSLGLVGGAGFGVFSQLLAGNTNAPVTLAYDDFEFHPLTLTGYELQRYDTVTDVWQTIMKSTHTAVNSFNDYEARVGVESSYRIRSYNVLGFNGQWSSTATGTVAEPGVTLPSCGTNKRGVLLFTSNESQTGAYNLAYAMTWDGSVNESFNFPETEDIQFQRLHARDFQLATHGTERGGEQFTRTLLLANAAVALPRLANMKDLRDMAWADLPYVCVRDDLGDRWLASVLVPSGNVRRNRRLYNADVLITEVTDTPSPVAP